MVHSLASRGPGEHPQFFIRKGFVFCVLCGVFKEHSTKKHNKQPTFFHSMYSDVLCGV